MTEFKCEKCDKEFSAQQGLEDHNRNKHYVAPKVSGKKSSKKYMWVFLAIVLVIAGIYFIPNSNAEPGRYNDFATCLTDSGAVFYGAYWCGHCIEQKKSFGDSKGLLNYVECSLPNNAGQTQVCKDAGIEGYPTWEFSDGSRQSGFIPLVNLAEKTGCELPE